MQSHATVRHAVHGAVAYLTIVATMSCTNNPYPDHESDEKVVYLNFAEAPKTLDPAVAYDTAAHAISGLVHDTLLEYDYLKRPYSLIPGLAIDVPEPVHHSDGRVSYRFQIREDLRFQADPCFARVGLDSRAITADDF